MIKEDNKYIYIDKINDLQKLNKLKNSRYGFNSDIYYYNDDLLKIFNNIGYILDMDKFEKIMSLNLNNISIPKKFVFLEYRFFGYSMDYKSGVVLSNINKTTKYNDLILSLDIIQKTIETLSYNKIEMRDINCFNMLYDNQNKEINIIDIDNYVENIFDPTDATLYKNLTYFQKTLLYSLVNIPFKSQSNLYKEINKIIIKNTNNNINIKETFKEIKCYLENNSNKEIETIKDIRKVLKK